MKKQVKEGDKKMDWTQTYTIIGVNMAVMGIFATFIIWAMNKIDADTKGIRDDVKSVKQDIGTLGNRLDSHAQRIDQLYRMFVDLLKETKK